MSDLPLSGFRIGVTAARRAEEQVALQAAAALNPVPSGSVRLGYTDYPVQIGDPAPVESAEQLAAAETNAYRKAELLDSAAIRPICKRASTAVGNGPGLRPEPGRSGSGRQDRESALCSRRATARESE